MLFMQKLLIKVLFALFFFPILSFAHVSFENVKMIGSGELTFLGFTIYEAALYAGTQKKLFDGPLILELSYKTTLYGKRIADRSVDEMINVGASESFAESYRGKMEEIFPDVDNKTALSIHYLPNKGVVFYRNRKQIVGQVSDQKFSYYFLGIWLSPKTSEPNLRKKLLGGVFSDNNN